MPYSKFFFKSFLILDRCARIFITRFKSIITHSPKFKTTNPDKAQPWKVWGFVFGLNLVAWIGWWFAHGLPSG